MKAIFCASEHFAGTKKTSEPVEEKAIHDLLEAAMAAPSAGDERPCNFVVHA